MVAGPWGSPPPPCRSRYACWGPFQETSIYPLSLPIIFGCHGKVRQVCASIGRGATTLVALFLVVAGQHITTPNTKTLKCSHTYGNFGRTNLCWSTYSYVAKIPTCADSRHLPSKSTSISQWRCYWPLRLQLGIPCLAICRRLWCSQWWQIVRWYACMTLLKNHIRKNSRDTRGHILVTN